MLFNIPAQEYLRPNGAELLVDLVYPHLTIWLAVELLSLSYQGFSLFL